MCTGFTYNQDHLPIANVKTLAAVSSGYELQTKLKGYLSYQDAPLNHVHGGVGEDLLLDDGQGELAEDAQGPGLNFRLKTSKFEFKFCFFSQP